MANLQDIVNRSEVGAIKPWTKTTAPDGYLLCDGAAVSRTTYADLFGVISTTYGVGDGSTTFNLPNLQGKMPQGYDGTTYNLAGTGGANTVTVAVTNNQAATNVTNQAVTITGAISNTSLTTAQLAAHEHNFTAARTAGGEGPANKRTLNPTNLQSGQTYCANCDMWARFCGLGENNPVASSGSGTGHTHSHTLAGTLSGNITTNLTGSVTASGTNSFSPYVVVNYIIKH